MLEKRTVLNKIEIDSDGTIRIREKLEIVEDGVVISSSFHRRSKIPGEDVSTDYAEVQGVAAVIHTPAKIAEYQAMIAANGPI